MKLTYVERWIGGRRCQNQVAEGCSNRGLVATLKSKLTAPPPRRRRLRLRPRRRPRRSARSHPRRLHPPPPRGSRIGRPRCRPSRRAAAAS
eukprot:scaffold58401_cov66-Phaeocystis_antarctica.AAC.4